MLKNGLYNVTSLAIRMGLAVLVVPLLIRLVGLEEYGLWALVSATVGLVGLAEAGLSVSTTVFVSRDLTKGDDDGVSQTLTVTMGTMLLMATSAALVLWFGAARLVDLFPALEEPQRQAAAQALQIGGAIVWAQLLLRVLVGLEQAFQRYGAISVLQSLHVIFTYLGLPIVAALGGRVVDLVRWQAIVCVGILGTHMVFAWWLLRHTRLRPSWNTRRARAVVRYSVLTWAVSLGSALFSRVDRLIVGAVLGTSTLGLYAAITTIVSKTNAISGSSVQPLLPMLSATVAADSPAASPVPRARARQAVHLNALIALGIGGGLFVLAPLVMRLMVDTVTDEYVLAFRLATIIYALYSLNAVGYYTLLSTNAAGTCMIVQLTGAALTLLTIGIAASYGGLLGAILGNAGYLVTWLLIFLGMRRLGIPMHSWATWVGFPMGWFLTVVLLSIALPDQIVFRAAMAAVALGVLLIWFIVAQQIPVLPLLQKLTARR